MLLLIGLMLLGKLSMVVTRAIIVVVIIIIDFGIIFIVDFGFAVVDIAYIVISIGIISISSIVLFSFSNGRGNRIIIIMVNSFLLCVDGIHCCYIVGSNSFGYSMRHNTILIVI